MRKLGLSVLMPCLNPSKNLDKSIKSCLNNTQRQELIIADGMSEIKTIENPRANKRVFLNINDLF